jgi:hypothetical protein
MASVVPVASPQTVVAVGAGRVGVGGAAVGATAGADSDAPPGVAGLAVGWGTALEAAVVVGVAASGRDAAHAAAHVVTSKAATTDV